MTGRYCYKEVLPFTAMVAIECSNVGVNILFKEATEKGLSYYAFIAYSYLISTLFLLLPLPFVFRWCSITSSSFKSILPCNSIIFFFIILFLHLCRSRGLPHLNLNLIFRIFLLGVIG